MQAKVLRYSKYLFLNIIRKKLLWLLLFFSVTIAIVVVYLQVHEFEKHSAKFAGSINTVTKIFPFVFGVSFMALLTIYVFKEGEEDGTELMIVSKPLKRSDILLGKFSMIIMGILFYNFFVFLTYISVVQFDSVSSASERINFALSLSVGGLVVITIATSIIILLASFLGKVGTLAIGIVAATLVPITSSIISDVSKGKPRVGDGIFKSHVGIINLQQFDDLVMSKIEKQMASDPNMAQKLYANPSSIDWDKYKDMFSREELLNIGTRNFYPLESNRMPAFEKYKKDVWYQGPAYIDPWYQWGKFYDLFTGTNPFFDNTPKKWVIDKDTLVSINEEEALEKTTVGNNLSLAVDLFSPRAKNVETLLSNAADILSGKTKVMIFSNEKNKNNQNTDKDGLINWNEAVKMNNTSKNNNEFKTEYGSISVVDVFESKDYSFETRARAIMASTRSYPRLSSMNTFTTDELLLYKMVLLGTQHKDMLQKMSSSSSLYKYKSLTPLILAKLKLKYPSFDATKLKYEAPYKARDFSDTGKNNIKIKNYIHNKSAVSKTTGVALTIEEVSDVVKSSEASPLLISGEHITTAHTEPFIKENNVIIIWSVLGSLLVLLTIWRYTRRDFK